MHKKRQNTNWGKTDLKGYFVEISFMQQIKIIDNGPLTNILVKIGNVTATLSVSFLCYMELAVNLSHISVILNNFTDKSFFLGETY